MTHNPKISILCPSYNHENFVGDFINSILSQTEQNFELIIVDDHSSDKNIEEIKKFLDSRIKLIRHSYNQGINAGLNDAFDVAKGEYCVFLASDDMLNSKHLELTSKYLDDNKDIDIVYCALQIIDDNNQAIKTKGLFADHSQYRFNILMRLFMEGNILLSPGMVIRKDVLSKIMPLDLSMLQYQDYQMHINLLLGSNVHFIDKQLVRYRKISSNKNISAQTLAAIKRENLEQFKLMDTFLQIRSISLLKKIFGNKLNEFGEPTEEAIPYFLGRLALCSHNVEKQKWGYSTIMNFIKTKKNLDLLNKLYGFSFSQYICLVNKFTIPNIEKKYKKYRKLFNISLVILAMLVFLLISIIWQSI